jgi:prevent-host-death family protein
MITVNIHEAKTNLSRLLEEVQAGHEVIIAKRGKRIARLCPIEREERRVPGLLRGEVGEAFFEPLPDAELEAWER